MNGLGRPRVHHRTTDSTNERGKELAGAGAPHGTLVTTDEQTAGRGRQGRTWAARPGTAVLMSLVVRELDVRHAMLPLATAVAVCEAAEQCADVGCQIKWPNDVWIDDRKLSGILVEGRPQEGWAVVGVGINVTSSVGDFPEELQETATSLAIASAGGSPPSRDDVLFALTEALSRRLPEDADRTLEAWRGRDALIGRQVAWSGGHGTAAGVDDTGALIVETEEGGVTLEAGEVHLRVEAEP